ncbi:hypothetical protein ACP4OV_020427 [Aristida adscensionis]
MFRPPRPRSPAVGEASTWSGTTVQLPFSQCDGGRMPGAEFDLEEGCNGGIGSGTYFTDLLVSGAQESQDFSPNTESPIDSGHGAATKGSQGRTKNFRDEEDRLLVSAWLNVSMDPILGTEQSQTSYWARIYEYFHANKSFESDRSQSSLMNRWSAIQHDVNIFCGCVTRIEDRNQSGATISDKLAHTCTLFKEEDKKNRKFAFMHCWRILKDSPKWMERRKLFRSSKTASNKKQKTKPTSSPSSAAPGLSTGAASGDDGVAQDASKRPDGKKTEKKRLRQRATIEALDYLVAKMKEVDAEKELKKQERCDKAFALQEEKIKLEQETRNKAFALEEEKMKLEREKFDFQREQEEERILSLDLSNMTYRQKQYYEGRQNEILDRRSSC